MKALSRRSRFVLYAVLAVVIVLAVLALWDLYSVRAATKWLAMAHHYKAEVFAQRSASGQLKHIEWDGWGMAGQDTTVYLVFDPTDSLSLAAASERSGKFDGLPCEVFQVRRLENQWYAVQFYTNESWGRTNALNCTGG
ncbi:MAG TPA: hypothetical protein VFM77_09515 [Terriglobales bacterium]|nr:hypothetical protein [Terriglobales bacterium]